MEKPTHKLVGSPCGHHGQYTFYKALRLTGIGGKDCEQIIAIGDFFFVRVWQDSELVSIGELQLLWTDRVSDQTLVSLRLYFLPENTPEGRNAHGEDEVLAINEKVVLRADDLLSWMSTGAGWRWGLRAVWRGACAPPHDPKTPTAALHSSKLDFSDIDREKSALALDSEIPGVVVFSYPRYCRYRALLRRLEGIQATWLRDSLVAALGGYAAPTKNTRILYCKDTFEYPELEGHEFVCNHLAPRLKGRPRGRRRRRARSHSPSPSSPGRSSGSECSVNSEKTPIKRELPPKPQTPRRLSLRNGAPEKVSGDEEELEKKSTENNKERAFMANLSTFHRERSLPLKKTHSMKDLSLRALYLGVVKRGGYDAVCRDKGWRTLHSELVGRPASPNRATLTRRNYERILLKFEDHERKNGSKWWKMPRKLQNGKKDATQNNIMLDTVDAVEGPESMTLEIKTGMRLRTPSPECTKEYDFKEDPPENSFDPSNLLNLNTSEEIPKDDIEITSKPASELNQEFLDSLPKPEAEDKKETSIKISVKPVEKLLDSKPPPLTITEAKQSLLAAKLKSPGLSEYLKNQADSTITTKEDSSSILAEIAAKHNIKDSILAEIASKQGLSESSNSFLTELAQKLNIGCVDTKFLAEIARAQQDLVGNNALANLSSFSEKYMSSALAAAGLTNGQLPNGTVVTVQQTTEQKGSNGARPAGRSSLRSVRVKPAREARGAATSATPTPPIPPLRPDSASSSPPVSSTNSHLSITNFGINYPPAPNNQVTSTNNQEPDDDEIVEVPYKPNTPEIIDLDEYPESPQAVKKKKLEILKERGLEVTAIPNTWPPAVPPAIANPVIASTLLNPQNPMILNPTVQHQIMTQAQIFQMYNTIIPPAYANGLQPPKVIQGKSIFGTYGPEKTVYGNPKDPFMPPPHILHGAPIKPARSIQSQPAPAPVDILDLTCKNATGSPIQKPAVEIVRIQNASPSPSKVTSTAQNLTSKNYTLIDGKAVVGSNLEITLVGPKQSPNKSPRAPQKRSSNGQFMSTKTSPISKSFVHSSTSRSTSAERPKPSAIVVPNYQLNPRDDVSPTSSTSSRESNAAQPNLFNVFKDPRQNLAQLMDMQTKSVPNLAPYMDPVYMSALYNSIAGQVDQRQIALYRELMAGQFRSYTGLLNMAGTVTSTPTTKN